MAMTRNLDADSTAFTSRSAIGFKSPAGTTVASTMAELDTNITLHEDSRLPDEERAGVNSTAVEEIPTLSYLAVSNVAGPSGTIRG
ncbi:hypothetical protein PHLCEN_2v368 [Hermanssonia centrifuga]|uniref:Uncharacterized protein n=1 Tax=Hermanssonia centrifuga TaxID=98765 RepID=A0A2R6P1V0_9APHY|nr:hypothetical protein PHLCEN_2v5829 [Hermanssonia centrifuga]PSS37767.1 hypothetical protein PHLCEN_2v368 [Hermanssonia centrifuga]